MDDSRKKLLEQWENKPDVDIEPTDVTGKLRRIKEVLSTSKDLLFTYNGGSDHGSSRRVRPLELFKKGSRVYLLAMCRVRGEERVFRLDRIELESNGGKEPKTKKTRTYNLKPSGTNTSLRKTSQGPKRPMPAAKIEPILDNESVRLSGKDLQLREERKKKLERATELLKQEAEIARESQEKQDDAERLREFRKKQVAREKEAKIARERQEKEREEILAPYEKELARLEWWKNFWLWPICIPFFGCFVSYFLIAENLGILLFFIAMLLVPFCLLGGEISSRRVKRHKKKRPPI